MIIQSNDGSKEFIENYALSMHRQILLLNPLFKNYSALLDEAKLWSEDNPSQGQCTASAVMFNKIYGGHFMMQWVGGRKHFFNMLDEFRASDKYFDYTDEQFPDYLTGFSVPMVVGAHELLDNAFMVERCFNLEKAFNRDDWEHVDLSKLDETGKGA